MNLEPTYPIVTERLLLRPMTVDDVEAVHAYQSLPEVCAYVPYGPRSRDEIRARLTDPTYIRATLDEEGQVLILGVVIAATGELIGDVLLFWHSELHRSGEVGYELNPDHWGKGYVTEAAREMLRLGFDGLGLHRITARIDAENPASLAVARRLGMRQEAVLVDNEWFKGRWCTEIDFAILEDEWRSQT